MGRQADEVVAGGEFHAGFELPYLCDQLGWPPSEVRPLVESGEIAVFLAYHTAKRRAEAADAGSILSAAAEQAKADDWLEERKRRRGDA